MKPAPFDYVAPASIEEACQVLADAGLTVRGILREKGTPYAELGLGDPKWTDAQLLDFIGQYPVLINRPIVVTPNGVRLCRPSEQVIDLLPPQRSDFVKEDGERVADPRSRPQR